MDTGRRAWVFNSKLSGLAQAYGRLLVDPIYKEALPIYGIVIAAIYIFMFTADRSQIPGIGERGHI